VALAGDDVLELLADEFPDKYKEYSDAQVERQFHSAVNETLDDMRKLAESSVTHDCEDPLNQLEELVDETVAFNSYCNNMRKVNLELYSNLPMESRQIPRLKQVPRKSEKRSRYPVSLIPGQYSDNIKRYTSTELQQLPLKTVTFLSSFNKSS
jgi:hypothetical protein